MHWRNGVLLFASLVFYAWGEPVWILAMLFSTFVNYACAYAIDSAKSRRVRRLFLILGVLVSIAALVYCKYAAFFVNSAATLFPAIPEIPVLQLPIGISFYTFQVLTYTADVYRKKAPVQKNPLLLLLYVSCFPQLIAGPIVQYADVAGMLSCRESTADGFATGMKRFAVGLMKKVLIANICGAALEMTAQAGTGVSLSFTGAWLSAALFSMQLYFDFSAYSDMAIGLGRIFGFTYKENFNYPYISRSIGEFWRRWHISLGAFFRDYVYIPLGGNRKGILRTMLNLLIVWALTGLWHGASWNFVLWGVYYGVLLLLERFVFKRLLAHIPAFIRHILTLLLVITGWVMFYYTDFSAMREHLLAMIGLVQNESGTLSLAALIDGAAISVLKKYTVFPLVAAVACTPVIPWLKQRFDKTPRLTRTGDILSAVLLSLSMVLCVLFLVGQSFNPFIYFRF